MSLLNTHKNNGYFALIIRIGRNFGPEGAENPGHQSGWGGEEASGGSIRQRSTGKDVSSLGI